MAERPHRHDNSHAGESANRWNDGITASSSGPRRRVASGAPAAQHPTSGRSIALSSRAVASRCRPAHHRRHQHATPGGAVPAICSACAIRGAGAPGGARCTPAGAAPHTDGQLPDNGPLRGDQLQSWWEGQLHHHRAQPQEASRHRGSQPRERLQPACTGGCTPSCTCASPPWLPGSFGGGGGCMALAPHLHIVVWPPKFRPHLPEKYDGTVNPTEFLQIYSTSILTTGGNKAVMANYFPVALTGTARSWLMNLFEGTLHSGQSCATSSRPTSRAPMLSRIMRPISMPSSSGRGNPCAPSSNGSLRFAIPFLVSPMLL
jgi:hypothetical protein